MHELQLYDYKIAYLPVGQNPIADMLSQLTHLMPADLVDPDTIVLNPLQCDVAVLQTVSTDSDLLVQRIQQAYQAISMMICAHHYYSHYSSRQYSHCSSYEMV